MSKVFVTGIGIVSGLGIGVTTNLDKLVKEESGIAKSTLFGQDVYAARVPLSNGQLKNQLKLNPEEIISRTALLGFLAAKEAWGNQPESNLNTGFINSTTVGGMDISENYFTAEKPEENVHLFLMHHLGTITNFISRNVYPFERVSTISTACSSAANAIMQGGQLIENGIFDRMLVGGTDALCNFTVQGFQSLMVYSKEWCKPFDENRSGLNLGEGAAYLVLESEKSLAQTGNIPLAELAGWANANDAYHSTGTSPDGFGAQKAMREALQKAKLSSTDIDYVNAHGTATNNNDSSELAAMQAVFGDAMPHFSSTKAFTGHTLAPAGSVEAVLSILALQENLIFANLNCTSPMEKGGSLIRKTVNKPLNAVLSSSFGFGGNCTSLVFKKL